MHTMQFKWTRCREPAPEDEHDDLTPEERHLSWVEYWDRRATAATLDRAGGTYAALLPRLVAATGVPASELVRRSVARWLAHRREEEAAQQAAYRASLAEWYRMFGPRSSR